jgi:hypothetical protein
MEQFLTNKKTAVTDWDNFSNKVEQINLNIFKNGTDPTYKNAWYNAVAKKQPKPKPKPKPKIYDNDISNFLKSAMWNTPANKGFNAMHDFLLKKRNDNQTTFNKFTTNVIPTYKADFYDFKDNNSTNNKIRNVFYARVTATPAPKKKVTKGNLYYNESAPTNWYYTKGNRRVTKINQSNNYSLNIGNKPIIFTKRNGNSYELNFNKSSKLAYIKNLTLNKSKFGEANWDGARLTYGRLPIEEDSTGKIFIKLGETEARLTIKLAANRTTPVITLDKLPEKPRMMAWPEFLTGLPAKNLGAVDWDGDNLTYDGQIVSRSRTFTYFTKSGVTFKIITGMANGWPKFEVVNKNSNITGFYKSNKNYVSMTKNSVRYKPINRSINSNPIYQYHLSDKQQPEWYIKNTAKKSWRQIYKLANGKWSMNAPPGQGGAPPGNVPPPPPANYNKKTWEQLINIRNSKPNSNSALNAALNAAINKQLRSVNGNSRSRKFGVYGDILIKMGSSRNYPARGKVRDAIRTELRAALRNIRDPKRAKVELERAKANVRLSRIPTRNSNVRKAFEIEESNIKSRSREYNDNYGSNNNRRYGRRPPPFAPPRMPVNNRYNMGAGPAPFPRNNGFRAPPSESPFRLPTNAPRMPAMPPPRINLTGGGNQQAFAPSPMAPPPTNQSLLANLPANERAAINYAGGVNKAANLVNQAGGGTNVAAAANALAQTGGNVERAIAEKGANEKAIKVVIQLGGGKNLNNIERAKNALNGLNNVAVQLKKRKRRSKPKPKPKAKGKGKARAPKSKTRVVYRTRPGDRVRTAELNKLLNIATKDEITKRMENADLLNKVYSKAELARIYKKYVLGKNLPPLKKKRVLRSRAK